MRASTTISPGSAFLSIECPTVVISVVPMVTHLPPLTTVSACVPTIQATLLPPMNRVVTSVLGIRRFSVVDMGSTLFTILQVLNPFKPNRISYSYQSLFMQLLKTYKISKQRSFQKHFC